jgi:hypothetical protein
MFWNVRPIQAGQAATIESEPAAVRRVDTRQHVEQRGFAGTVGADEAVDLSPADGERNLAQRLHATKALGDALANKQAQAARSSSSRLRTAEGSRPAGR